MAKKQMLSLFKNDKYKSIFEGYVKNLNKHENVIENNNLKENSN